MDPSRSGGWAGSEAFRAALALPIRISAIAGPVDGDGVGGFVKKHSMVSYSEAKQALELTAQRLYPSFSGFGVTMQGRQNLHRSSLFDGAHFRRNVRMKANSLHAKTQSAWYSRI
jgi:hypothetical protein